MTTERDSDWKLEPMGTCNKCGKQYGKTNLTIFGSEVWQGCGCMPKDKVYYVDSNNIKPSEPSGLSELANSKALSYPPDFKAGAQAAIAEMARISKAAIDGCPISTALALLQLWADR